MRQRLGGLGLGVLGGGFAVLLVISNACWAQEASQTEPYVHVPMPPHFSVQNNEFTGPVFADATGRTLYKWPFWALRGGYSGDTVGHTNCTNVKTTVISGYMSPYPAGLILPDLDTRPSCTQAWPPALASADAQPIGQWTLIQREDGRKQWAYDGHALYTSRLDHYPGEVTSGDPLEHEGANGDFPALRWAAQPPPDIPAGFLVKTTRSGRLLENDRHFSIYASDRDQANKSHCDSVCAETWIPLLAAQSAHPHGDWSVFERSPGVLQWAYRKRPLYRYALDSYTGSFQGSDVPGWHNVYTQTAPLPPGFTLQTTSSGEVLADPHGKTIYIYFCADDAVDQLGCDHPTETQAYRLMICGGGDPDRCLKTFPYVLASKNAKCKCHLWSVVSIDPHTGQFASPGQRDALRVWAYRDRPVYTYAGDRRPGDFNADGMGEFRGEREGFRAFWLRDDFNQRDQ